MQATQYRFNVNVQPSNPSSSPGAKKPLISNYFEPADRLELTTLQIDTPPENTAQLSDMPQGIIGVIIDKIVSSAADPYHKFETLHKLRCANKKTFIQTIDQIPQLNKDYQILQARVNFANEKWRGTSEPELEGPHTRIFKLAYIPPQARQKLLDKVLALQGHDFSKSQAIHRLLQEIQYLTPLQQIELINVAFSQERVQFRTKAFDGLFEGVEHLDAQQKQSLTEATKELLPLPGNKSLIRGLQRILKPE